MAWWLTDEPWLKIRTACCLSTSDWYIHNLSKLLTSILLASKSVALRYTQACQASVFWSQTSQEWLTCTIHTPSQAIVKIYPALVYINLSSMLHLAPSIRYLWMLTLQLALSLLQPKLADKIKQFCHPNQLGTQTLSSALLPFAQASVLWSISEELASRRGHSCSSPPAQNSSSSPETLEWDCSTQQLDFSRTQCLGSKRARCNC